MVIHLVGLILIHNHYHIICEKCGKIVDFHYPQLDEVEQLAQHVTDFDVTHHRMEIYGYVKNVKKKEIEESKVVE